MAHTSKFQVPGYSLLRSLSLASNVYLCRENASDRFLVLKIFTEEKKTLAQQEIKSLVQLKNYGYAPDLLFAFEQEDEEQKTLLIVGQEYFSGETLHFIAEKLNPAEKVFIATQLKNAVNELHQVFLRNHGDISPKNILVKQNSQNQPEIRLIDWEFSESLSKECISSHSYYRGTLGYAAPASSTTLLDKDIQALVKLNAFLNVDAPKPKRSFKLWLQRT